MRSVLPLWLVSMAAMASGASPERPAIAGIANMAVKVSDLAKARNYYEHVLGLPLAFTVKQAGGPDLACFKVNDHQYVEVSPQLANENEDRLLHIGFETADARALRKYMAKRGVKVPAKLQPDTAGNLSFAVTDPDGHTVEFVQYLPGSIHSRNFGKFLSDTRISDHILHVGIKVADAAVADKFYQDILGFKLLWKGGPKDDSFTWVSMKVRDGGDWVEYMVSGPNPTPRQLGGMHHFCLQEADEAAIKAAYQKILERGYKQQRGPFIARDGRWLLNIFDPDLTRTELMVRKPVQTPCCSPLHDE